ncbi:P-loop containing nucleoside triphosphate hydrolase protein [Entophlyctis helioformis]|nr:P-loop containing nucleoside triphosphate hydrolase protein [Entophlyctis helioformis]
MSDANDQEPLGRLDNGIDMKALMTSNADLAVTDQLFISFEDIEYSIPVKDATSGPFAKLKSAVSGGSAAAAAPTQKTILNGVSGAFRPGRLTAVMGASGAGKTSLLQVLAGESKAGSLAGSIRVNGEPITGAGIKKLSGFVFQDDVILPTMTVEEAITMSALLRLPESVSLTSKQDRVNKLIHLLNLEKARNTMIGSAMIKGISGGERKRTAMAMEMITNPGVLFLDEPTSGLDTFTAYSVVRALKILASTGRSVITTIHQPSSEIFHMFDDLLLLADGRVIYQGPAEDAVEYFGKLGYQCGKDNNPADYIFMSILNNEEGALEDTTNANAKTESNSERIKRLLDHWSNSDENKGILSLISDQTAAFEKAGSKARLAQISVKVPSPFSTQLSFLFKRTGRNALRNPLIMKAKVAQTIILSMIIGLVYLRTDLRTGYAAHQNRQGFLFFLVINNVMSSTMGVLSIFAGEKQVFMREYGAGYYNLMPFFLSKIGVEMPTFIVLPWLQTLLLYWMVGLQSVGSKFMIVGFTVMLSSLCGFSLGIFFACVMRTLEIALGAAPLVLMPLTLLSGLFVNSGSLPAYFAWIQYISPMKYGFQSLVINEYGGLQVGCTATGAPVDGSVCVEQLGLNNGLSIAACCGILVAMVFALLALGYASMLSLVASDTRSVTSKDKLRTVAVVSGNQ